MPWWTIADSGRTCPLLVGGWDDHCHGSRASKTAVSVKVPLAALTRAPRGYVRFRCDLDQLKISFLTCSGLINSTSIQRQDMISSSVSDDKLQHESTSFDFEGGTEFHCRAIDRRRPHRVVFRNESPMKTCVPLVGELYSGPSSSSGVPVRTLSDLLLSMCHDLRAQYEEQSSKRRRHLSPSLVKRICDGHFLGVLFCQVQCICTRCNRYLVASKNPHSKPIMLPAGANVRYRAPIRRRQPRQPARGTATTRGTFQQ